MQSINIKLIIQNNKTKIPLNVTSFEVAIVGKYKLYESELLII